jgi:WhiB family redox-sensing transcriptional regulator
MEKMPDKYAWMAQGQCRSTNTDSFFPSHSLGVEAAQRLCAECPVRSECLDYALLHRIDHGVWGGTSERERQRIIRQRRGAVVATRT